MARHFMRRNLVVAILLVLAGGPTVTEAATLHVYDRDSLVYLSTDVIEARIVRNYQAPNLDLIDVKVALVHKGKLKTGMTVVVVGSDYYRKPKKHEPFNNTSLEVGELLVLFLVQAKPSEWLPIPNDAVIYKPLPGGVRLVQGDHVFGFSQWNNPGPYMVDIPSGSAKTNMLTIGRFRDQVRDSLRDTEQWARLVEAKQDQLDMPCLLKMLAGRPGSTIGGRDYFSERICMRLAETHAPELLARALNSAKSHSYDVSILQRGFGTPKGRDYLLAKVTNAEEPMQVRLRFAHALQNAGAVYLSTLTEIAANSHRPVGEADKGNSEYLTRIARAARDNGNHLDLCKSLVHCLDWYGRGIVQNKSPSMMTDLHGALAVLKELYDTKPSEQLQFAIESATANADHTAYEKLNSPCGTFISILSPVDPTRYTKPKERSLLFEYAYNTTLLNRETEVRPSVVLVHQETKKRYVLPTQMHIGGNSTGGGSRSIVLPSDLPVGRYHIFFEVREEGKVTSTGHFFAAEL